MRKIAIVSNNPDQRNTAEFVNSCDEVIRFSDCKSLGPTGGKTTGWVTRSKCAHTNNVYRLFSQRMKKAVENITMAFMACGFPEYNGDGVIIGREIVTYDTYPLEQLRSIEDVICHSMPSRGLTLLHPGHNPTLGFMFLWNVLNQQWFEGYERYLVGWDFVGIDAPHKINWEAEHTNKWLEKGYFKHAP